MINKLKNIFWKPLGLEDVKTPQNTTEKFALQYKDLVIGELQLKNGEWSFHYTPMFQIQNEILPLVDFPNKAKNYKADELWPFFISRLPGLGQPEIQQVIKMENIDSTNEVELLKRFGLKSITNPFILTPKL